VECYYIFALSVDHYLKASLDTDSRPNRIRLQFLEDETQLLLNDLGNWARDTLNPALDGLHLLEIFARVEEFLDDRSHLEGTANLVVYISCKGCVVV
jgi:hypothetical protein